MDSGAKIKKTLRNLILKLYLKAGTQVLIGKNIIDQHFLIIFYNTFSTAIKKVVALQ